MGLVLTVWENTFEVPPGTPNNSSYRAPAAWIGLLVYYPLFSTYSCYNQYSSKLVSIPPNYSLRPQSYEIPDDRLESDTASTIDRRSSPPRQSFDDHFNNHDAYNIPFNAIPSDDLASDDPCDKILTLVDNNTFRLGWPENYWNPMVKSHTSGVNARLGVLEKITCTRSCPWTDWAVVRRTWGRSRQSTPCRG